MDLNIDIKNIKLNTKNFFKEFLNVLKDLKTLPNLWSYILLSIVLTLLFLILTFPYGSLIRTRLHSMGENIGRGVYIGEIDFSLIRSTNIESMTIILKNGSEINIKDINLDIGIFSLIFSDTIKGNIEINNIKYSKDKTTVSLVIKSRFILKFKSLSEYPNKGKLKIELQNVIAEGLTIKGFDIPPVRFTSIIADANIQRKRVKINEFSLAGPDLSGNVTGHITLTKFLQRSQLNLDVEADSSSALLENYKILLEKWIDQDTNKIKLSIKGSISNPRINAKKNSSSSNGANSSSESN